MLAALIGLSTAIVGGILLFPRFGHVGVAAAIAISGWVGASVLNLILRRRGWLSLDAEARQRLPRIVLATIVMACAVALAAHAISTAAPVPSFGRLVVLAGLVMLGVAVYLGALQVLGVAKLKELAAAAARHGA
jgi:putative peptidoglycan lipid II flippase